MIIREEIITSRQNPTVKRAASLSATKGRAEARAFLAEGVKLTEEALRLRLPVQYLFSEESKKDVVLSLLAPYRDDPAFEKTEVITLTSEVFEKISTEKAPQGVTSVIKYLDFYRETDIINKEVFETVFHNRILALSSLRDPLNIGAVIRSAAAFGVGHIVLSSDCADVYHPKCVRASMASLFHVRITVVKDFGSFVRAAREAGRRVYAAELRKDAVSLADCSLRQDDIFVIGNEGHGIDPSISSLCTASVYIPIADGIESLNASVAAAVFMWEQKRIEG